MVASNTPRLVSSESKSSSLLTRLLPVAPNANPSNAVPNAQSTPVRLEALQTPPRIAEPTESDTTNDLDTDETIPAGYDASITPAIGMHSVIESSFRRVARLLNRPKRESALRETRLTSLPVNEILALLANAGLKYQFNEYNYPISDGDEVGGYFSRLHAADRAIRSLSTFTLRERLNGFRNHLVQTAAEPTIVGDIAKGQLAAFDDLQERLNSREFELARESLRGLRPPPFSPITESVLLMGNAELLNVIRSKQFYAFREQLQQQTGFDVTRDIRGQAELFLDSDGKGAVFSDEALNALSAMRALCPQIEMDEVVDIVQAVRVFGSRANWSSDTNGAQAISSSSDVSDTASPVSDYEHAAILSASRYGLGVDEVLGPKEVQQIVYALQELTGRMTFSLKEVLSAASSVTESSRIGDPEFLRFVSNIANAAGVWLEDRSSEDVIRFAEHTVRELVESLHPSAPSLTTFEKLSKALGQPLSEDILRHAPTLFDELGPDRAVLLEDETLWDYLGEGRAELSRRGYQATPDTLVLLAKNYLEGIDLASTDWSAVSETSVEERQLAAERDDENARVRARAGDVEAAFENLRRQILGPR